ncbi:MAG: hypothetical protein JW863_01445, partial [Chitinispirillaceae bacterium]|nr:hypothetical protein [Chitinispirillaceae bacterium]
DLVVSKASDNLTLIPLSSITLEGTGADRTVTVTPAEGVTGDATIIITVSDGAKTASTQFVVTVNE